MGKARITKDHEKERQKKNFLMAMALLIIMVISVVGFALISGGRNYDSNSQQQDLPLQADVFTDGTNLYWGAVINGEQFVFDSVEGYEEREDIKALANQIKSQQIVNLYIAPDFTNSDALYLIEKKLGNALQINFNRISNESCTPNTLILTTNLNKTGNCMIFKAAPENIYEDANVLAYHMLKVEELQ